MLKIFSLGLFVLSLSLQAVELSSTAIEAIKSGNEKLLFESVKNIEDANAKNNNAKTALMLAVWEGKISIVKLLISKGAIIDSQDSLGKTALMLAVWRENLEIAKVLMSSGANISLKNSEGLNALDIAHLTGNGDMIDYLEKFKK